MSHVQVGGMPLKDLKMSLDECISNNSSLHCNWKPGAKMYDDEVGYDLLGSSGSHISQMAFFCGNQPECNFLNGDTLLSIAKYVSIYTPFYVYIWYLIF